MHFRDIIKSNIPKVSKPERDDQKKTNLKYQLTLVSYLRNELCD